MSLSVKKLYTKYSTAALIISISAVFFLSCSDTKPSDPTASFIKNDYFDTELFFKTEVDSLKQANPEVEKTVSKENETETKTLKIKNWENELSSFTAIDLRKPAYSSEFKIDTIGNQINYTAKNPELDVQRVSILLDEAKNPIEIIVEKSTKNMLYSTDEKLSYAKGAKYSVEKNQSILILGDNRYIIQGNFISK
ncbi:hypothetical protein [Sphingobacterium hungaricum]|uniref:Uncharacterized protein n=1 Tax=Sphingobacterium hungaricum TaxID=2082723 RepID=A0A928YRJ2_9SPHI|nr:hypothetical protein [Sphingobacterium hungaricum]MBE8715049.1 hypothetical protein [Sphingobacterium hungaricum]